MNFKDTFVFVALFALLFVTGLTLSTVHLFATRGDLNSDGVVDIVDLSILAAEINSSNPQ